MKKLLLNLWDELKSVNWNEFIKWSFILSFVFGWTVMVGKSPSLFLISCVVVWYIYALEKQIDNLQKDLKEKEREWRAVDIEERLKALKSLQTQEEE